MALEAAPSPALTQPGLLQQANKPAGQGHFSTGTARNSRVMRDNSGGKATGAPGEQDCCPAQAASAFTCSSTTPRVQNHPVTTDTSVLPQHLGKDGDRPQVSHVSTQVKSDLCSGLVAMSEAEFSSDSGVTPELTA
ncbi:hypothetical protein BTVI_16464 [Pitangus sulphuratus]|nr:hypothetical protein BTVI_16464 [Pitangus sulphuratus]